MADRTNTFYALDDAIQGYGAQLLVGDGASPEQFEAIAGVISITPGSTTTEDIDRSHLRSPNKHREHGAGWRDTTPFSCTGRWLPKEESQSTAGGGSGSFTTGGIAAIAAAGTTHNFVIRLNDGSPATELAVRGYISEFTPGNIEGSTLIDLTFSIQPTEAYTLP